MELKRKIVFADKNKKNTEKYKIFNHKTAQLIALGIILFCSGSSIVLYQYLGQPNLPNLSFADRENITRKMTQTIHEEAVDLSVEIHELIKDLNKNPNNLKNLTLLGRFLTISGQFKDAVDA